mgnify:CR=1 FL=1
MILTPIYHKVEILLISYPIAWGGTLLIRNTVLFWKEEKCSTKYAVKNKAKFMDFCEIILKSQKILYK